MPLLEALRKMGVYVSPVFHVKYGVLQTNGAESEGNGNAELGDLDTGRIVMQL